MASRAVVPHMRRRGGGAIVNVASLGGLRPWPSHLAYCASKAALVMATRCLAVALAPQIRVNAVAPSLTDTPLAQGLLSSEEKRKASAEHHPSKRIGTPLEIAQMAVHLLSDASAWMTGQIIHVDGGISALRTFR